MFPLLHCPQTNDKAAARHRHAAKDKGSGNSTGETVERKEVNQEPPLLYDLTTLQKRSEYQTELSADKTLIHRTKLYEGKPISYPEPEAVISHRTCSRKPERSCQFGTVHPFCVICRRMKGKANSRSVNDGKVTDHHALIVTENLSDKMEADEQAIYELIAGRMLEAFSENASKTLPV